MMKSNGRGNKFIAALAMGVLIVALTGCDKEGPMEHAGKEVDKAVDKTGQQIDNAIDKTGQQIEKAGDKVKDAAKGNK